MPAKSVADLPDAFKNLTPEQKAKGKGIFNALLKSGVDEGVAIATAIKKVKEDTRVVKQGPNKGDTVQFKRAPGGKEYPVKVVKDVKGTNQSIVGKRARKTKEELEAYKKKKKAGELTEAELKELDLGMYQDALDAYIIRMEKTEAKYKKAVGKSKYCGNCKFFQMGTCSLVEGHIENAYTCNLWTKALPSQGVVPYSEQETRMSEQANQKDVKLVETASLIESKDPEGLIWDIRCISTGLTKNKTIYSFETLRESVDMFSGVPCFADHGDNRSVRDVVGWLENARLESDGIYAEFHALEATPWFRGPMMEAYQRGKTDLIGFSINGDGTRHPEKQANGQLAYVVDKIKAIESVDGVINPSAGGQVRKLVADMSGTEEEELMALEKLTLEELKEARPDLYEQITGDEKDKIEQAISEAKAEGATEREAELKVELAKMEEDKKADFLAMIAKKKKGDDDDAKKKKVKEDEEKTRLEKEEKMSEEEKLAEAKRVEVEKATTKLHEQTQTELETVTKLREQMEITASDTQLREKVLAEEGLPQAMRDALLRQFSGRTWSDDELQTGVDAQKAVLKGLQEERPASFPQIEVGDDAVEKAKKALEGMLKGEDVDGVPQARSIKEAYSLYTGRAGYDVNAMEILRETYNPQHTERIREATGISGYGQDSHAQYTTSGLPAAASGYETWSEVMSEFIHKRLLEVYNLPWMDGWRSVATSVISIPDFKTQRRVRIGGYGNFGSVGEASVYQPATTPTDQEASYKVTKYGATEKMTLEAIANDDVGAIRRIPTALARGAKTQLHDVVMDLIYTNPTLTYPDAGVAHSLVSTYNANSLASTTVDVALTDSTLQQAKRLLSVQTELNSGKQLGLRVQTLFVTPELEVNAQRLQGNEFAMSLMTGVEGTPTITDHMRDINTHRNTFQYQVVPNWGDASAWFAIASPADVPLVEVGFYQGKQEPELFVQDMQNVGTNFDLDVITYKARIIFGGVLLDHRGIIGSSILTRTANANLGV